MDLSDQILKLFKQLFETIQKLTSQIEITIDKKKIQKNCLWAGGEKEEDKEQEKGYKRRYLVSKLEKIKKALACKTELLKTDKLPSAYWFYKIGEQLDLKTPYEDLRQKTFNKEAIQQVEKFVKKNNLTLYYKEAYILYAKRPKTSSNNWCSPTEITQQQQKFKIATTPDATTLEYYQSIYTHCKQRFNIPDGIEVVKKSVYQYIENHINNYLFGNYNISEIRSNLYNNLVHYSQLETKDLNSETLATYFHKLNFNIIKYCEETYPVQSQYSIDFELETETSNKGKNKLKQYSNTTPNTPTLPKTTAKYLQTPEQGTSSKLPLTITPFPASLVQAQTSNSPLNQFARPENFTSLRSPTRQQESLQTSSNLLDFLAKNQSEHSETAANKENKPEISKEESIDNKNKEDEMTTYIAKIPEFNGEDIETSPQEWLNQITKNAFKAAFLEQFTDNNTSITLCNCFRNIKQEPSESVITYIGKFNKLLRQICQLKTNDYYFNAQILDQFITGLKDKLIKKVCLHASEDLNSAIEHVKRYEMAMEKANYTKLVNLAIRETSSAAEKKIDQLTKKVENYFTNQQQQQPQRYQPPQRRNQNNFTPLSNKQPQNCHYCRISGHWKRDCRKLQ
ncbi:hypothetical protein G9A89_020529 [Geosiphon pyriformis]|nr:hypothetical protein G9A89_020529 [Geosiphon pyriformis]